MERNINKISNDSIQNRITTSSAVVTGLALLNSSNVRHLYLLVGVLSILLLISSTEAQSPIKATIQVPCPDGIGVNHITNRIYVANSCTNTVSVIDGIDNSVISTILVGSNPIGVGVNPMTEHIYVANSTSLLQDIFEDSVVVIDGNINDVISIIPVGVPPGSIGVNPTTNFIYVSSSNNTVTVIDDSLAVLLTPTPQVTITPLPTPIATPTLTPIPSPTPVITPGPSPIPTPGKLFTLTCEDDLEAGPGNLEKLVLELGKDVSCILKILTNRPGRFVEVSTNLRTGFRSSIKVFPIKGITDINAELEFTISAIDRGIDWVAWAIPNEDGEFEFSKREYEAGLAWGMFVEVR